MEVIYEAATEAEPSVSYLGNYRNMNEDRKRVEEDKKLA